MNSQQQFCPEDFSLAAEEAVHEVCCSFETALRRGESPTIKSQLAKLETALHPLALYELVKLDAEFQKRQSRLPSRENYQKLADSAEAASAVEAAWDECAKHPAQGNDPTAALDRDSPDSPNGATKSPAALPKKLGRYVIQGRLGQGGMGAVFKAFDNRLQRYVALKIPHYDRSSDSRIRKRFRREALALASLRHDMIVPVYDVEREGDYEFLTMALVEGEPLRRYVQPEQPVAARHAAVLVRSLAKAMQYVHDRGVIHRDLKPENIILEGGRKPVIVDFGLARAPAATEAPAPDAAAPNRAVHLGKSLTRFGLVAGTPDYSSPEQLAGDFEAVGPHSDVYSLGVILFELLTGKLPWDDQQQAQRDPTVAKQGPALASDVNSQVDPRLARICAKAIDPLPANRPQSMDEFADALKPFCTAHAVHHRLAVEGDAPGNENVDAALVLQEITRQAVPRFSRPAPRRPSSEKRRRLAFGASGIVAMAVLVLGGLLSLAELLPGRRPPESASSRQELAETAGSGDRPSSAADAVIPAWEPLGNGPAGQAGPEGGAAGPDQRGGLPPAWDTSIQRLIEAGAVLTFQIPGPSGKQQTAIVRNVGTLPQRPDCTIIGVQLTTGPLDATLSTDLRQILARHRQSIRELELRGILLDEATLEVIAQLTELELLSLAETNLQNHSVALLGQLTQLQQANLSATALSDAALGDLIKVCRALKGLRSLDLRKTQISQSTARALEEPFRGREVALNVIY